MERSSSPKLTRSEELRFEEILTASARNKPSALEALVDVLEENDSDKGRIGVDMENLNPIIRHMLGKKFPKAKFGNASELIRLIRMVKTPEEMEHLKRAAIVNENAISSFVERIAEGITEKELAGIYRETVAKQFADVEFLGIYAGPRVTGLWPPSDYRIKKGDVIFWDVGCTLNMYHADTGNVAVLGKPSKQMLGLYEACNLGVQSALERVAPGTKVSEVTDAMNRTREKFGMQTRQAGNLHGVGLEIREYPIHISGTSRTISDDFVAQMPIDMPLEKDMVINIENPYRKLGVGAVQIEVTTCVTDNGFKYLIPQERFLNAIGEDKHFALVSGF